MSAPTPSEWARDAARKCLVAYNGDSYIPSNVTIDHHALALDTAWSAGRDAAAGVVEKHKESNPQCPSVSSGCADYLYTAIRALKPGAA